VAPPSGGNAAGSGFAVWLIREVAALLFVAGWLLLFAGELLTGRYTLPFWVHGLGTGVLGYALGLNAAELIYRPGPSAAATVAHAVLEHHRAEEDAPG
jgi:hypothetical protein